MMPFLQRLLVVAALMACGVALAQVVVDPDLSVAVRQTCIAEFADEMRESCTANGDGGGPKSRMCLSTGKLRQNCIDQPLGGGTISPKYIVVGLIYSPPGCSSTPGAQCGTNASVAYQSGSTLGTKLSISSSLKTGTTIKSDLGISLPGINIGVGAQDEFSQTKTDTTTTSMTKSRTVDYSTSSTQDGLDYTRDQMLVMINPMVMIATAKGMVNWKLGSENGPPIISRLPMSYLLSPASIPANSPLRRLLTDAGINDGDLAAMAQHHPFANLKRATTGADLDTNRFAIYTTITYVPFDKTSCAAGVCSCVAVKNTFSNSFSKEVSTAIANSASHSDIVSAKFSGNIVPGVGYTSSFSATDSVTFTNTATLSNSTSDTNMATVTIPCPSPNWNKQSLLDVYWDGLYGSFAFVLRDLKPHEALLATAWLPRALAKTAGTPLARRATLHLGGQVFRSVAKANGQFNFYGEVPPGVVPGQSKGVVHMDGIKKAQLIEIQAAPK